MKIAFLINGLSLTGGYRTVFEISHRLIKRGHEVKILYPLTPNTIVNDNNASINKYKFAKNVIKNLIFKTILLDTKNVKLESVPSFGWNGLTKINKKLHGIDIAIATAWETAYTLNMLGNNGMVKVYFVQHYEIWDIWNDEECWDQLIKQGNNIFETTKNIASISLSKDKLQNIKNSVDNTFKMGFSIITTSNWLKDLIKNSGLSRDVKQVAIGNSFLDKFDKRFLSKKNGITILMPLRGAPWKGDKDGLIVLNKIKESNPDVEVVLFGLLQKPVLPNYIKYYYKISDSKLAKLYSRADIFLYPSWVEGWGSPPMEAMSCKTACVVTNTGAIPEYCINGINSYVVEAKDTDGMTNGIQSLICDENKIDSFKNRGYEAVQKYTWEKCSKQFEIALVEIMKEQRQQRCKL